MEFFLFIIVLVLLIFVIVKSSEYSRGIENLREHNKALERRISELEIKQKVSSGEARKAEAPVQPKVPEAPPKPIVTEQPAPTPSVTPPPPVQKVPPIVTENIPPAPKPEIPKQAPKEEEKVVPAYQSQKVVYEPFKPKKEYKPNEFWTKLEKQFAENWTGILGAVIMVAGVIFLGIYAALKLSPFNRFLLITGFAVLLVGAFVYLKRYEKWVKFALWLRSSAGAVFLFGCLGSAGIPGLQWLNDPLQCMLILDLGIAVNIYLGYAGGTQVYASMHVLLSLIALSIAPQATLTLGTAAVVTLFGVALTYKEKWHYHLLLTISSFFVYHLYWFFAQHHITTDIKIVGIVTVVAVSISVALVHYRKAYGTKKFDALPFTVHLVNWLYFGTGLFLYSSGMRVDTFLIAIGAIVAFFLARHARKLDIRWLYHTDTLMAQASAIIALLSLRNWQIDGMFISSAVFLQVIMYMVIMVIEKEDFLYEVGLALANLSGVVLFLYSMLEVIDDNIQSSLFIHAAELIACFGVGIVFLLKYGVNHKKRVELFGLFGIVLSTLLMGFYAYMYHIGSVLSTVLIFSVSVITYLSARMVRNKGIKWLYYLLTLVAQAGILLGFFTLHNWGADNMLIVSEMFAEILLFCILMIYEDDSFLYGVGFAQAFGAVTILLGLSFASIDYGDKTILYRHAADLFAVFALASAFMLYGPKKKKVLEGIYFVFAALSGGLFISLYIHLYHISFIEYPMALVVIAVLFVKDKWRSVELEFTSLVTIAGACFINWYFLYYIHNTISTKDILLHSIPLFAVSLATFQWPHYFKKQMSFIGIYLFAAHAVYVSYFVFNPISLFAPGIAWLLLSVVALELSHFTRKRLANAPEYRNETDRSLLHVGYMLIFLFFVRHLVNHLPSNQYLGHFIKMRFVTELLAAAVFIYWASAKNPPESKYLSWRVFHPLFIELIIGFFVLTVCVESTVYWFPIVWIISAFGMCVIGNMGKESLSRLKLYSLFMYWASAIQVAFVTGNYVTTSTHWYDQASYSGSITILLQFAFLTYFYKKCKLADIQFPRIVVMFKDLSDTIDKQRNAWVFYPLFICTALFLYFSFDKSVLTFLWVLECFMVFILSVILKEKYFRYVSFGAIVLCVIRLVFYDLSNASTLTRAFVFFGVGVIMLVINAIFNRYKERFD